MEKIYKTMQGTGVINIVIGSVIGEEKLHLLMVDDHIPAGAKLY